MTKALKDAGVRSKLDARDNYTPGWKYNHWELKGVPLRVEYGMRDLENGTCVIARRDNKVKETVKLEDLPKRALELCVQVQSDNIVHLHSWDGFIDALDAKKLIMTPWCNTKASEEIVKTRSSTESTGGAAKTLCIPFEQPVLEPGTKCFITGEEAKCWVLWGRSY
jgi:prolyl-tRNA synthetase